MRRLHRVPFGVVPFGALAIAALGPACHGPAVGPATSPDVGVDTGTGAPDAGEQGGEQGALDTALPSDADAGGAPLGCTAPSCTPSLLIQVGTVPGSVGRQIYMHGAVLDGQTIYAVAQVIGPTGTALTPNAEVSAIDVSNGSRSILSGADEAFFVGDSTAVAVDATDAYWWSRTMGNPDVLALRKTPKGQRRAQVVGSISVAGLSGKAVVGFTLGATDIYWGLSKTGIYHCPKTDCSSPTLLKALPDLAPALSTIGDYIYWGGYPQGEVWRRGLSGTALGVEERLAMGPESGPAAICGFAVDGPSLFWAQCDGAHEVHVIDTAAPANSRLSSVPGDQTITSVPHGSVVVDAQSAYFLGSKYAYRVPRSGGRPQAIGVLALTVGGQSVELNQVIGVDATSLYLLASTQAAIFKLQR